QKLPNAWGLYDMQGNVSEWCADWLGAYAGGGVVDPTGPATGIGRVCRGGMWINPPRMCRCAGRAGTIPATRRNFIGFRVVLVAVS
ncbi:MAG: SUMF1/EgtB/PvdO family nonheme iron enzyme, partial [Verrucomicrobiae bacterium]|nr:SUMF1/EgtB/PvdO family nonheme iron enzyme [Verrucomicrobiae bacterium]